MTPSIYDFRDNEIVVARAVRRQRIARIIEAVVCGPVLVAAVVALLFI